MAKIKDGSTYLDGHLTSNDYYAEGEHVVGQWRGRLVSRLGMAPGQQIHSGDRSFRLLRGNINPVTNQKLTQRNGKKSICFFDFQCSAQKSVSILHALTGDERLAAAHDLAAAQAFAELESFAACRVRAGAAAWSQNTRATGNLCAAVFRHDTSRALDPQLHTHFVIANATWDETQQRMVALESCEMVKAIRYAGKVYQNALARELQALGYDIEEMRDERGVVEGFEIQGVSAELRARYSKRRAEVEAGIKSFEQEKGRSPSRAEIAVITRQTRSAKMAEISTPAVHAAQLAQLSEAEHEQLRTLTAMARRRAEQARSEAREVFANDHTGVAEAMALEAAVAHRYERASVLYGHDVLAEALNTTLGLLDLASLKQSMQTGGAGLVALDADARLLSCRFATREGLALERWSVGFVNGGIDRCAPLFDDGVKIADWLADEQREAVRFVGSSRDRVMAIRGIAGAGKTTMLKELNEHLSAARHRLLYLAPTAAAVEVLKTEGFTNAMTVSAYLVRTGTGRVPPAWQDAVVVVDEAGLSSNGQGAALLQTAKFANQRVVLVGDTRQHSSVDAGDFMRVLEDHSQIHTRVLKDIRRQTVTAYRQAVELLAQGQAAAGMEQIDRMGWIKEEGTRYLGQAAKEYLRLMGTTSKASGSVLCVAPTWAENNVLTTHIRAGLRAAGTLGETRTLAVLEPLGWTTQQRVTLGNYQKGQVVTFNRRIPGGYAKDESREIERIESDHLVLKGDKKLDAKQAASYDVARWREIELAVGDKILLRANRKKSGLINGNVLTVAAFGPDGSIQTAEGKTLPADYRHFTHGYAITSHKSQGRTTDHVVVAAQRLDAKAAYVACSRGRKSCTVFTPDRVELFAGLPRSADRAAALDVLRAQKVERQQEVMQSDREARRHAALVAADLADRASAQSIQARCTNEQPLPHQEGKKETNQQRDTYAEPTQSRIPLIARAIAAIQRTIESASRALDAGQRCLARAARSRRLGVRATDEHHRRRSRGPATVRVQLVQTLGGGLDHAGQRQRGDPDQRQPGGLGQPWPGGPGEPANAGDRPRSEPAERREARPGPSTEEVTATVDLPADPPREAREREEPVPALPVRPGTQPSESAEAAAARGPQPKSPRTLYPMTAQNSEFLERFCGLTPEMVAPFAHQLHSTHEGHLIAPHNGDGDGEEYRPQADGSILQSFTGGSRDDGRGRGPSVWSADPEPAGPIHFVLVAESMLVAIAAAARLVPEKRACTRIVSTTGDLTKAGQHKLIKLIRKAQRECDRAGAGKVVLVDASDLRDQVNTAREDKLYQVAASTGAKYERWAPEGDKNWLDVVIAERRAREAASAQEAKIPDPVPEQDPPEPYDGPRPRRRSR